MSYELVKNISVRNRTITAACNNIRPLIYTTSKFMNDDGNTEHFIKRCLVAFNNGEFQSNCDSCWKFNYAVRVFKKNFKTLSDKLEDVIWNSYDYKTKTYLHTEQEIKDAQKTLEDNLYELYKQLDNRKLGKFVLLYNGMNVVKITSGGRISCTYGSGYKLFDSYEEALTYSCRFGYDECTGIMEIKNK